MASQKMKISQQPNTPKGSRKDTSKRLTICVSSRSLLYIEDEFEVYEKYGEVKYNEAMKEREKEERVLDRGTAFPFIKALAEMKLKKPSFDIVLLSNNNAQAGVAIIKALNHHELNIKKIFLTSRDSVIQYLGIFDTVLYLSAKKEDVIAAHKKRYASLQVEPGKAKGTEGKLNVTFGAQFIRFDSSGEEQRENVKLGDCFSQLSKVFTKLKDIINSMNPERRPFEVYSSWSDGPCELCTASSEAITICISARSLFDLETEHQAFGDENDHQSYSDAMQKRANDDGLNPGSLLPFVKAVDKLQPHQPTEEVLFDVVLVSQIGAPQGVPILKSIVHHELPIERVCLTAGKNVTEYLRAFKADVFISANAKLVGKAHGMGIATAEIYPRSVKCPNDQLRMAFDFDLVLFDSRKSKKTTNTKNCEDSKCENEDKYVKHGPLRNFARKLGELQKKFPRDACPIRTYLVTKRHACEGGEEVILTFRNWGLNIDEIFFTGKTEKISILENIQPHIFFDDSEKNLHGEFVAAKVPVETDSDHDIQDVFRITVCVSSRSLFYLEKGEGGEATTFERGTALPFVLRMLEIKKKLKGLTIDIVLLSKDSVEAGIDLIKALQQYELEIERLFLTAKNSVTEYLKAFGTVLYLSEDEKDVTEAREAGYAAVKVEPGRGSKCDDNDTLDVTFGSRSIRFDTPGGDLGEDSVLDNCSLLSNVLDILEEIIGEVAPKRISIHRAHSQGSTSNQRTSDNNSAQAHELQPPE